MVCGLAAATVGHVAQQGPQLKLHCPLPALPTLVYRHANV